MVRYEILIERILSKKIEGCFVRTFLGREEENDKIEEMIRGIRIKRRRRRRNRRRMRRRNKKTEKLKSKKNRK